MIEIFWGCLVGGIIFAILSLILGDIIDHGLDSIGHSLPVHHFDFLNPTTFIGGITAFGGAGILLTRYTDVAPVGVVAISVALATLLSILVHFVYIRPMRRSENSVGFSIMDYPGQIGRITIPIPANGYGEVMIQMGGANTCQIATSHTGQPIAVGTLVVVVEAGNDALTVEPFESTHQLGDPNNVP